MSAQWQSCALELWKTLPCQRDELFDKHFDESKILLTSPFHKTYFPKVIFEFGLLNVKVKKKLVLEGEAELGNQLEPVSSTRKSFEQASKWRLLLAKNFREYQKVVHCREILHHSLEWDEFWEIAELNHFQRTFVVLHFWKEYAN